MKCIKEFYNERFTKIKKKSYIHAQGVICNRR